MVVTNNPYNIHFTGKLQRLELKKFGKKASQLFDLSKQLWAKHPFISVDENQTQPIQFVAEPAPKEEWITKKTVNSSGFASENFQQYFAENEKILSDLKKISNLQNLLDLELI